MHRMFMLERVNNTRIILPKNWTGE